MDRYITVQRQLTQKDLTLSSFSSKDINIKGVGIEDEKRNVKVAGETRIDAGIYPIQLMNSPHFSKEYWRDDDGNLIHFKVRSTAPSEVKAKYHTQHEGIYLLNIKNFVGVMWHWGNTDDDTEACYIVGGMFGKLKGQDAVLVSRMKYVEIYPKIFRAYQEAQKENSRILIQYIDSPNDEAVDITPIA